MSFGSVEFYNEKLDEFTKIGISGTLKERQVQKAKQFAGKTPRDFHWTDPTYRPRLGKWQGNTRWTKAGFTIGMYRPFFKRCLYFNTDLNHRVSKFPAIYPRTRHFREPWDVLVTDSRGECAIPCANDRTQ